LASQAEAAEQAHEQSDDLDGFGFDNDSDGDI